MLMKVGGIQIRIIFRTCKKKSNMIVKNRVLIAINIIIRVIIEIIPILPGITISMITMMMRTVKEMMVLAMTIIIKIIVLQHAMHT